MDQIAEEAELEGFSDRESNHSEIHDQNDMFFSCADWETQIKNSHVDVMNVNGDFSENEIEENIPFYNKRMAKAMTKYGSTPEAPKISLEGFDVDLVMKKAACFNQTERIVSAKAYLRAKPVTPFHKMHNLTVNTQKESKQDSFADVCLSPMASRSSPTVVKFMWAARLQK